MSLEEAINKSGKKRYEGSTLKEGVLYHNIVGIESKSHRNNTKERVNFLLSNFDFKGKKVLDIGCSVGGISLGVAKDAKHVHGVDYDPAAIEIAQEASKKLGVNNVSFEVAKVDPKFLDEIEGYDVILWLSHWMWFVKQQGMDVGIQALYEVSKKTPVMFFESAADDGMAAIKGTTQEDIKLIFTKSTTYQEIKDFGQWDGGGWLGRKLLMGAKPKTEWSRHTSTVERNSVGTVIKKYKKNWKHMAEKESKFLEKLDGYEYFPKLIAKDLKKGTLTLTYEGCPATDVSKSDADAIIDILKKEKIVHRDIIPSNFVFNGKNAVLLDFAWSSELGNEDKDEAHIQLGEDFKHPDKWDDKYSIDKVRKFFAGEPIKRRRKSKILKILALPTDDGGCGWYRVRQPFSAIRDYTDHDAHVINKEKDAGPQLLEAFSMADIILVRPGAEGSIDAIKANIEQYHKEIGYSGGFNAKWVMDIDDNIEQISPYSLHYHEYGIDEVKYGDQWLWKDGVKGWDLAKNRERVSSFVNGLSKMDLITVTTDKLAEYVSKYNENVAVLPNSVNFDHWWKPNRKKNKQLRVGWSGGASHYEDWFSIKDSLNKLMRELQFKLVMIGHNFSGIIDEDNKHLVEYHGWVPFQGHSYRMMCMDLDLAIVPLEDLPFNHYKSSIKLYEMSAMKVPSVVSNILPYKEDIDNGLSAFEYNTPDEFETALRIALTKPQVRKKVGEDAYKWVKKNRNQKDNAKLWIETYESIL